MQIKYMVSNRCILMVEAIMDRLLAEPGVTVMGEVELPGDISEGLRMEIALELNAIGLELLADKKEVLVEKIKNAVKALVHDTEEAPLLNLSAHLSQRLGYNYTYLANVFSESLGDTIEHFLISHKVEKIKELIVYNELNLTEIAFKMHYSSIAHMSNQFKKTTGFRPSFYRTARLQTRINLENL